MEESQSQIIVIDEPRLSAEEPVFAGLHGGSAMEQAYSQVMVALKGLYAERYRHAAPADDPTLFHELDSEVILPHAAQISKLVRAVCDREQVTPSEEEHILRVVEDFILRLKDIE